MAFRRLVKQLTCPQCGDVVADAAYRPFPSSLVLRTTDGAPLRPTAAAVLVRLAQAQLDDPDDPGRADAEARMEFIRENIGELMFDLRCRRGHVTLATTPGLVRAMKHTPGTWVTPR